MIQFDDLMMPDPRIWKWVLMVLTIIILMLLLGCSASWHVRQAVRKDPGMFKDTVTVVTVDTLRIDVPVVEWRDRLKRDTLVEYRQGDVVIRYRYSTLTDTLVVEADCPDKEVVTRTETNTVPPVVVEEGWRSRLFWLLASIGMVLLVGLVIFMILRR